MMKRAILACMAAITLCSGCMIFEDGFIEDDDDEAFASHAHPAARPE